MHISTVNCYPIRRDDQQVSVGDLATRTYTRTVQTAL